MRDKLIDIILEAQGFLKYSEYPAVYESVMESHRETAAKIADALLDECYIYHPDFCIEVGHDDPVGEMGEPGTWVSVEDALPKEGEDVLAIGYWHEKFQPLMCYLSPSIKGRWFTSVAGQQVYSVTYWMPLPAPPKEE